MKDAVTPKLLRSRAYFEQELSYAASRLNEAQRKLDDAERTYGEALRAMEAFDRSLGA